jgi:ABC-2 type transport system ATP-binding protein
MASSLILRTVQLSKRFRNRWAVNALDLEVQSGQVFGFLGPNGAGKSTTIRMLLSLIRPSHGSFELFGQDIRRQGKSLLARVGALVEKPDFYLFLTARENLEILGRLQGKMGLARIDEVLKIVRLSDRGKDKVKSYSHGMRQRLGIAQAILGNPDLIILDEPTTGLDPEGMKEIRDLIYHLAHDLELTIFLSSHLLHEVEQICTHMAIINQGKLVVRGAVAELLNTGESVVTEVQVDDLERAMQLLDAQPWINGVERLKAGLKVRHMARDQSRLTALLVSNGFQVSAVIPYNSLEAYYLSLLSKQETQG